MRVENMVVVSNRCIAPLVYELVLKGEMVTEMNQAGQFVDLKVPLGDLLLRRPISICSIDSTHQEVTLIIRANGEGTKAICDTKVNEALDVLGPLGMGFPIDFIQSGQTALLIGGGIGIPPLYELAKQLSLKGVKLIFVFGFQTKSALFYQNEFESLGEVHISTDDGSYGTKGTVETILKLTLNKLNADAIYACGPKGLNRMVNLRYEKHPHAYISLEERMACGIGACAACVCDRTGEPKTNSKVCEDGPVFKSGEVII
jgi:dihydroorotate dehydrogenase electron transfer subunit